MLGSIGRGGGRGGEVRMDTKFGGLEKKKKWGVCIIYIFFRPGGEGFVNIKAYH